VSKPGFSFIHLSHEIYRALWLYIGYKSVALNDPGPCYVKLSVGLF